MYFHATDLMVSMFTASMRANISARDMLLPYVKTCRPSSSAEALVPDSACNNKERRTYSLARPSRSPRAVDEVLELAHDGERGVVETFEVVAGHVHTEQTGIGVVGVESHEGVTELVGGEDLRELGHQVAGADGVLVPAANHGLHQHERHGVRRGPGRALERHGEAARRHVVVTNANFATRKVTRVLRHQRLGARALRREVGERLFGELDEVIVVHRTGTDENHSRGGVVRLDVRLQVFLRHGSTHAVRTEIVVRETLR